METKLLFEFKNYNMFNEHCSYTNHMQDKKNLFYDYFSFVKKIIKLFVIEFWKKKCKQEIVVDTW